MVQLFLEHGAEPTATCWARSVQDSSSQRSYVSLVVDYAPVDLEHNVLERDEDGCTMAGTAFHLAVDPGDRETLVGDEDRDILSCILKSPKTNLAARDHEGYTVLHRACLHPNQTILSHLLLGPGCETASMSTASIEELVVAQLGGHRTALAIRMGRTFVERDGIVSLCREMLLACDSKIDGGRRSIHVSYLAVLLLVSLEDSVLAKSGFQLLALRQTCQDDTHTCPESKYSLCDICDRTALDSIFVCTRCDHVVICGECFADHMRGDFPVPSCASHSFKSVRFESKRGQVNGMEKKDHDGFSEGMTIDMVNDRIDFWLECVKAKYGYQAEDGTAINGYDRRFVDKGNALLVPNVAVQLKPVELRTALLKISAMEQKENNGSEELVPMQKVWRYVEETLKEVEGWEYIERLGAFWQSAEKPPTRG
jgi:hypothetical protein